MCAVNMKKGDIPGARMFMFIGVIIIGMLFFTTILTRSLTPSLKTSDEARASYIAHTLAYYISALSAVDKGIIERDFEEPCDVEIKKYTWLGTLTHFRKRPSVYYLKVTVYREGGQKFTKLFPSKQDCDLYCSRENCRCEKCSGGTCTIVNLKKSATSEAVPFIGFVDIGSGRNSLVLSGARFISLSKETGGEVKIEKIGEGDIKFCTEPGESEVKRLIDTYSSKYGIDKDIVRAVITAESGFRHCDFQGKVKTSFTGQSYGIMQLLPSTANYVAQKYGETIDYRNPLDNIKAGIIYLHDRRKVLEPYTQGEDLDRVMVASYNCGKILELVKKNCKKNEPGCWDKIKQLIYSGSSIKVCKDDKGNPVSCCQGAKGDETYNYVRKIFGEYKPCFERNPDCYYACYHASCKKREWEVT